MLLYTRHCGGKTINNDNVAQGNFFIEKQNTHYKERSDYKTLTLSQTSPGFLSV